MMTPAGRAETVLLPLFERLGVPNLNGFLAIPALGRGRVELQTHLLFFEISRHGNPQWLFAQLRSGLVFLTAEL